MISNLLYLNRIKIDGNWELDHTFTNGINAIFSDNQRGKTTIVNLIFKGLAINNKTDDICNQNVKELFLEIKLNEKKYTIRNDFSNKRKIYYTNDWNIDSFELSKPKKISLEGLKHLIEKELNINEYKRKEDSGLVLNNLGQCYRAFYLTQGQIKDIIARYPDVRRTVIKSFLRKPSQSNIFKDERLDLKYKRSYLEKMISSFKLNLDRDFTRLIEILKRTDDNESDTQFDIENLNQYLNNENKEYIKNKLVPLLRSKEILRNSLGAKFKPDYIENNQEIIEIDRDIKNLSNELIELKTQLEIQKSLLNEKQTNIDNITEKIIDLNRKIEEKEYSFEITIEGLKFSLCPRCVRPISNKMYRREKETIKKCALCNRELVPKLNIALHDLEVLKLTKGKEKKFIESEINKLKIVITKIQKNVIIKDENLILKRKKKKDLEILLFSKLHEDLKDKFIQQEDLITTINNSRKDLEFFNNYDKLYKDFSNHKENLNEINKSLREVKVDLVYEEEVENFWIKSLELFLAEVTNEKIKVKGFKDNTGIVKLEKINKPPDHTFNMMNVGYYYAFLRTSLHYDIKFPRIVFLDCFATEELISPKIKSVIEIFLELKEEYKRTEFQVFLVTASPEVLEFNKTIHILSPIKGEFIINTKL